MYHYTREQQMNIRLDHQLEDKLNFFAGQLHMTKTNLVKPYVIKLLEDLEDYYNASIALKDEGSISFADLEKEFINVAD
jgi:predicted DNA-binding protein